MNDFKPKGLFCGACPLLNLTEGEQDYHHKMFKSMKNYKKPDHRCLKFAKRVRHFNHHPKIMRLGECIKEYGGKDDN